MAKGSGGTRSSASSSPKGLAAPESQPKLQQATQTFSERGIDRIWSHIPGDKKFPNSGTPQSLSNHVFDLTEAKFNNLKKEYPNIGEYGGGGNDVKERVLKAIIGSAHSATDLAKRLNSSNIGMQNWNVVPGSVGDIVRVVSTSPFGGTDVISVRFKKNKK